MILSVVDVAMEKVAVDSVGITEDDCVSENARNERH